MKDKNEKINLKLSSQIKEAREKKGLTQSEVAKRADITETFYAMIERGEANPSYAKLERILKVLGLKIVAEEV